MDNKTTFCSSSHICLQTAHTHPQQYKLVTDYSLFTESIIPTIEVNASMETDFVTQK